MKKINWRLVFLFLLNILLILKLILFDRNVVNIVLSCAFLGFYLITLINYFRKKETNVEKKYLEIILILLVLSNLIQTGILLFSGKNIVLSLFNFIVSWMILNSSKKLLNKKEYNAKKVFVASVVLSFVPLFKNINLELISNVIVYCLIAIYFNNCKENYFGLFDASLINSDKKEFKFTQWIKTILIILVGICFLYLPILGSVLTVILWFLCFGGFFDNLILVYEQKLFNKKLRKNKEFVASKLVYSFASNENEFLKNRLESVAKSKFLEVGIPYEVYALMDVNGYRKYESIKELVIIEKSDLVKEVSSLFKKNVRPEVICEMLKKYYDGKNKKVFSKVEKSTNNFYGEYFKLIDEEKDIIEKSDIILELYKEYCSEIIEIIK